jgi:hypothetical protein
MRKKIKIEFHSPSSFYALKEAVWEVCRLLYDLEEATYYERISMFKQFAVFKDKDKIVGFLSFFIDKTLINSKSVVLLGIGHGGILPEYRNQRILPLATLQFLSKIVLRTPLKQHFIWGMALTHLSYRMGLRGTKFQYPTPDGNCPPRYKELLDWVGNKYFSTTYCASTFTAKVSFSATEQSAIPSDKEMEDPVVANFIERIPSALSPNNNIGAFSITPIGPNVVFWLKRLTLGRKKGTKDNHKIKLIQ